MTAALPDELTDEQMTQLLAEESGALAVTNELPDELTDAEMAQFFPAGGEALPSLGGDGGPVPGELPDELTDVQLTKALGEAYRDPEHLMTKDEFASWVAMRDQVGSVEKVGEFLGGVARGAGGLVRTAADATAAIASDPVDVYQNSPATMAEGVRRGAVGGFDFGRKVVRTVGDVAVGAGRVAGIVDPEQDPLETDFQRYLFDKGMTQALIDNPNPELTAAGQYGTGFMGLGFGEGSQPAAVNEPVAEVVAMASDLTNIVPLGVGLKGGTIMRGGVVRGVEGVAGITQRVVGGAERVREAVGSRVSGAMQDATGLTAAQQTAASVVLTPGAAAVAGMVSPQLAAGTAAITSLPATSAAVGLVLKRTRDAAGAVKQIALETRTPLGSARAADTAAAKVAANAAIPSRYRDALGTASVESAAARVAANESLSLPVRRMAKSLDNEVASTLGGAGVRVVGGAVEGGAVGLALGALTAEDVESLGEVTGGGVLFGGVGGGVSAGVERFGAAGRQRVGDADVARMFVDVERAGGDVAALSALSHEKLQGLASMQGLLAGSVDFVPLKGAEYIDNLTVLNQTGAVAGAGAFVDGAPGQRPRIFINLDDAGGANAAAHEFGHALIKSPAMGGTLKNALRNFAQQTYGAEGVRLRGREYARKLLEAERRHVGDDSAPTELTASEAREIESGRTTFANVNQARRARAPKITEGMIDQKMQALSDEGVARGDMDPLDWARDEVFAEQWANAGEAMNLNRIRAGMPAGGYFPVFAEAILAAQARVFESLGVKVDRQTGAVRPQLFTDHPLVGADVRMRKQLQEYARTQERWLVGNAYEKTVGVKIAPRAKVAEVANSPFIRLQEAGPGLRENEFLREVNGQLSLKPQKEIDTAYKTRAAQLNQFRSLPMVKANDPTFGPRRRSDGQVVVSGARLPQKFDFFAAMPPHLRRFARELEQSADAGGTLFALYHSIGSSDGGSFKVKNLGNLEAIQREVAFFGWRQSKNNNLLAEVIDITTLRGKVMRAQQEGKLALFNNDLDVFWSDLKTLQRNHAEGLPGAATIGIDKRDAINAMLGINTVANRGGNPRHGEFGRRSVIKSFRLDRLEDLTATGRDGIKFDYWKANANLRPGSGSKSLEMAADMRL